MIILDIPAGGIADNIGGMQAVFGQVYDKMMVHSGELIGIGQSIAGFGALWFIGVRVWRHMARAEAVDIYPLLRPFVIGYMIALYPALLGVINGVMEPTVTGTAALVKDSNQAVATLLEQRQLAIQQSTDWQMYIGPGGDGDLDKWEALSGEADSGGLSGLSNRMKFEMAKVHYNMKNSVKVSISEVLEILFESAALCINTVRLFFLIVLSIFGPLALGLSLFDGLRHSLDNWLAKYINVFLWLPVANIFGSIISQIQQEMIKLDIAQLNNSGQTVFGPTDTAYLIFLVMGIAGYCTVPGVTNYIVRAGSGGARQLYSVINKMIYHV
jgi:conjugative transposon TraJ protein